MTHPTTIEPGQEYESYDPGHGVITRIRIKGTPTPTGRWGVPNVAVITIAPDGRELRPRTIPTRHLHASPTRKTGYRLVQHADGTPANQETSR
ncbi:hypothetical protein ACIO6U_02875 [Streptomyces sp. NPDC087422]|uniref:hypothetical protein n=1 Tax=Streptomyces sp. NPDC087422 TaxID=3365786 RepID=UPI0037FF5681